MTNGVIVVSDTRSPSLSLFSPSGVAIQAGKSAHDSARATGGALLFPLRGDSVVVAEDSRRGPIRVVSAASWTAGRSIRLPATAARSAVVGVFRSDGGFVTAAHARRRTEPGRYQGRDTLTLLWHDDAGATRAALRVADAVYVVDRSANSSGRRGGEGAMVVRPTAPGPISRSRTVAVGTEHVFHFDERGDALNVYSRSGTLERTVLVRPLAAAMRPKPGREVPSREAQWLEVLADDTGRVWVEVARREASAPRTWWVFDPAGRWLAVATTPAGHPVLGLGSTSAVLLRPVGRNENEIVSCTIERY